jgi:hypothetical protein
MKIYTQKHLYGLYISSACRCVIISPSLLSCGLNFGMLATLYSRSEQNTTYYVEISITDLII